MKIEFLGVNKENIVILRNVIEKLVTFAQNDSDKPESGGLFIGKLFTGNVLQIEDITYPMKNDIQTRNSFFRSFDHAKLLDHIWEQSNGIKTLVGTWHTHPEDDPIPSVVDIKEWKKVIRNNKHSNALLIFAIVGIGKINFWQKHKGKFIKLNF